MTGSSPVDQVFRQQQLACHGLTRTPGGSGCAITVLCQAMPQAERGCRPHATRLQGRPSSERVASLQGLRGVPGQAKWQAATTGPGVMRYSAGTSSGHTVSHAVDQLQTHSRTPGRSEGKCRCFSCRDLEGRIAAGGIALAPLPPCACSIGRPGAPPWSLTLAHRCPVDSSWCVRAWVSSVQRGAGHSLPDGLWGARPPQPGHHCGRRARGFQRAASPRLRLQPSSGESRPMRPAEPVREFVVPGCATLGAPSPRPATPSVTGPSRDPCLPCAVLPRPAGAAGGGAQRFHPGRCRYLQAQQRAALRARPTGRRLARVRERPG